MNSVIFLIVGAISAVTDLLYDRIFNGVVLSALLTVLLMRFAFEGPSGLLKALLTCVLTGAILFPVYLVKGLGAGDVKLISVLTPCLYTVKECIYFVAVSFAAAALIGVILMTVRRRIRGKMHFAVPVFVSAVLMTGGIV